ncbi:DUF1576 domain-containing protein [Caviibacter abscessus]|uniref:DUF1576 domain-containing protein n=1 Tax=Caviibacter abscessus TaxID=1766719 RepID=UPI00082C3871|nr:DUF1576 domain-containing protein [Caviibacter abscessus]
MNEQKKEYLIISILPIMMVIFAFYLESPQKIFIGMINIFRSNDILISDYFIIGNIGAAFLNSALITLANIFLIYKLRLRLNGLLIMSLFIILSFGFMGKNGVNIIPFYIGTYLYAVLFNKRYKTVVAISMLSTTLAPVVSSLGIYGIFIGIIVGFIMPVISKQALHFHNGYSLYNSGLSGGLLGIVIYSIISAYGINFDINTVYYMKFDNRVFYFFIVYFLILIFIGLFYDKKIKTNMISIYGHTGRLVTDFVQKEGFYAVILNMGTLGLISVLISKLYGVLNGPVICSMLTIVAFGGFGKHIKNVLPLIIGVSLAPYLFKIQIEPTILLMTMFFSTTLAPISGKFGITAGIIAGILHYALAVRIGVIHGGINLYNNGLAAGILASVYVPVIEEIKGGILGARAEDEISQNGRRSFKVFTRKKGKRD